MKTKLFIIVLLCLSGVGWGQEFQIKDTITLLNDITIKGKANTNLYDYISDNDRLNTISANQLPKGYKYFIADINDKDIILKPLNFKLYNTKRILRRDRRKNFLSRKIMDKSLYGVLYNDKKFSVNRAVFYRSATYESIKMPDRVSFGLLTLPFKFRMFDDKSFETNFNLNTTLNVRVKQLWSAGIYVQFGAGIGNTNLYNGNAPGVDPGEEINAAALTILSGVMLQYKKVQAGLYIGWDHINNQKNYQWQYNGKPWLGFGVGYQLI